MFPMRKASQGNSHRGQGAFLPSQIQQTVTIVCIYCYSAFDHCHSSYFLVTGWALFVFVSYRVSQLKVEYNIYNPFEILGIKSVCLMSMYTMVVSNFLFPEYW